MRIDISDKQNLMSQTANDNTIERTERAFSKFERHIQSITISVQDANGPRGGVDKICRIVVRLKRLQEVVVTSENESLASAITEALNRTSRSVNRKLSRREKSRTTSLPRVSFGY